MFSEIPWWWSFAFAKNVSLPLLWHYVKVWNKYFEYVYEKKIIPLNNFSILILQNSFYPDIASASTIFHPTSSFLSKNCTSIRKLPKKNFCALVLVAFSVYAFFHAKDEKFFAFIAFANAFNVIVLKIPCFVI